MLTNFTPHFLANIEGAYIPLQKFLPIMKGYTLEDKTLTSLQNYGSIYT